MATCLIKGDIMRKTNWLIDPLMAPIFFIGFLAGYIWHSFLAGVCLAEYLFDPYSFEKKYKIKMKK